MNSEDFSNKFIDPIKPKKPDRRIACSIPNKIENAPPSKDPITPVNLIIIEYISIAVIFSFSLTEFITLPCIAGTINALVIPVIPEAKYASNKKFWF